MRPSLVVDVAPTLRSIYGRLYEAYGPQRWWPSQSAFETIAGAILTQNTAWTNVEKAIQRLRAADVLSPASVAALDEEALAELIRPSGSFRLKARRLKAFCSMLDVEFHGSLDALLALPSDDLRVKLLNTYGIGPETADAIMLYAAGKPSFVIDAYTRRMFTRLGLIPKDQSYEGWRAYFMSNLPADAALFNECHALIVKHAKHSCGRRTCCASCVLHDACPTGLAPAVASPGVHQASAAGRLDTVG